MRAARSRVTGRVQGVGFRMHAAREAERLGLAGWVRNASDGSVEVHAEGDDGEVTDLLTWLAHGPPSARVEDVVTADVPPEDLHGFRVDH